MSNINSRLIEELIEKRQLTPYSIAKTLDVGGSATVDNWIKGKKDKTGKVKLLVPSPEYIVRLCDIYKMDLVYIMTGEYATKEGVKNREGLKPEIKYDTVENVGILYRNEQEKVRDLKDDIFELKQDKTNMQQTINGLLKSINLLENKYARKM